LHSDTDLSLHRCHTEDLAPLLLAQLLSHDAVDSCSNGISGFVDQDTGVVVESNNAAISPVDLLSRPYHHGVSDITTLDLDRGRGSSHSLGAGASLLLNDADNSVTWKERNKYELEAWLASGEVVGVGAIRTDRGMSLLADNHDAFHNGCPRVVDAVKHRLATSLATGTS